jgi:hypothetical protein
MTKSEIDVMLGGAREELVEAQHALETAELNLPGPDVDTTMATPALLAVLDKVRAAHRHVQNIEQLEPSEVDNGKAPEPAS